MADYHYSSEIMISINDHGLIRQSTPKLLDIEKVREAMVWRSLEKTQVVSLELCACINNCMTSVRLIDSEPESNTYSTKKTMIDPGLAVPKGLEKGLLSKLHMTRKWRNESEKIVTGVKQKKNN